MKDIEKRYLNYFIKYIRKEKGLLQSEFEEVCSVTTLKEIEHNSILAHDITYELILDKLGYDFSYEEYFFSNEFENCVSDLYEHILRKNDNNIKMVIEQIQFHLTNYEKYVIEQIYNQIFSIINECFVKNNKKIKIDKLEPLMYYKPLIPVKLGYICNYIYFCSAYNGGVFNDLEISQKLVNEYNLFSKEDPLSYISKIHYLFICKEFITANEYCHEVEEYFEQTCNYKRKIDVLKNQLSIYMNCDMHKLESSLPLLKNEIDKHKNEFSNFEIAMFNYQLGIYYFLFEKYAVSYDYFYKTKEEMNFKIQSIIMCNYLAFKLNEKEKLIESEIKEGKNEYYELIYVLLKLWLKEFEEDLPVNYKEIKKILLENKKILMVYGKGVQSRILEEIIKDTAKVSKYYKLLK